MFYLAYSCAKLNVISHLTFRVLKDFLFTASIFYTIMNKIIRFSVTVINMKSNIVHDEIKAYITRSGQTLTSVVEKLNLDRPPEKRTTVQNISNKLTRGTIKYSEAIEIAAALGLSITWE